MKVGDVVLVWDKESPRNQWPLAVVTKVFLSDDQLVRKVQVTTAKDEERKFFERPVHKLVLLLAKEDNENWFISSLLSISIIIGKYSILYRICSRYYFYKQMKHLGKQCNDTRLS